MALAVAWGASALWRAHATLADLRAQLAEEGTIRFTVRPLQAVLPTGLEYLGTPSIFTDAQVFEGRLFLSGPTGLFEYDTTYDTAGAPVARYRAGAELPPNPVTVMAIGLAGDSHAAELWIGTAGGGLVAYDSHSFRQILPKDARFRKITALLPLQTGRILLGTEKAGVLVWDGHDLKPFHNSLNDLPVTALAGDDTSLWVGTLDRGLVHWSAGAVTVLDSALPDRQILSLALAGETIYAGTGLGIAEVQNDKVTRLLADGYFAQSLFVPDSKAGEKKLWMGTLEEGAYEVPLEVRGARGAQLGRASVCPECSIRKLFSMEGATYALAENGLWRGTQQIVNRDAGLLKDRNIAALSLDGGGRLWVGYFDRGLQVLSAGAGGPRVEQDFEDDHLFCVNRIVNDAARGITAVATANGLVLFDATGSRHRLIGQADGLIANQVTDVALRPDGSIVAATPAGISFIDESGISSIYAFQGLVNNHVYALALDGARTLAGTLGGLSVLDGGLVKASYTISNSALKHNWITAITRVKGNEWFVGTYGAGVLKFDEFGHWETFEDLRGPLDINSNAMASTSSAVYAGTLDHGLAVYSLASGRWNFFETGLPSENVTAVEARGGMLYIGTDNGLVKIPETAVVK